MRIMMIATAAALATSPALAQQSGLINVDLSGLSVLDRAEIAKDINVDVSQIPVNVQVPVSVAAAICNVPVNVLAQNKTKGDTACKPTAGSDAINSAVQKQLKQQR
jgi:hypothetical protein